MLQLYVLITGVNFFGGLFAHIALLSCAKVLVSRCPVWILTSIQVEVEVNHNLSR